MNASKLIASLREEDTLKNAAGERTLIAQLVRHRCASAQREVGGDRVMAGSTMSSRFTEEDRERIKLLMEAYWAGDADRFRDNMTSDLFPWRLALKEFVKLSSVPPQMQSAFQTAWIWAKHLPREVDDHPLVCAVARVMLPAYAGPAVRLFRGACLLERQRRIYGLSWAADIAVAESFAKDYQEDLPGDSVVLETLAPSAAIICEMSYPEPFTAEERASNASAHFEEFHDEREYIVDRRLLKAVTVVRRLPGYSQQDLAVEQDKAQKQPNAETKDSRKKH